MSMHLVWQFGNVETARPADRADDARQARVWRAVMATRHFEEFLTKAGIGATAALCAVFTTLFFMAIWDKAL